MNCQPSRTQHEPKKKSASAIGAQRATFQVGDRVRGTTYVLHERRNREVPEPFDGTVVQIGSGWNRVDFERAYLWVKLADCTERQALVEDTELVESAPQRQVAR